MPSFAARRAKVGFGPEATISSTTAGVTVAAPPTWLLRAHTDQDRAGASLRVHSSAPKSFHDIRAPHSYRLTRAETQTPPSQAAWLVIHPDLKGAPATRVVSDPILSILRQRLMGGEAPFDRSHLWL